MQKTAESNYNLTSGGILSKLLLVALPIMGTQLMQMAYNLTDMFWLGRVGSEAVAASGTAGMFLWLSMAFLMIGRMGAEIGTAQSLGRGDEAMAKRFSQNAALIAILLGALFALTMILFRGPLVGFFHIREQNVVADTENYLMITALAIPATFVSAVITGSFNGSGNSRTPFIGNAVGLVFNMILDPVMIFGMGMGVDGAAIATSVSQLVVMIFLLAAMKASKGRPFQSYRFFHAPDVEAARQIFRWSVPIGLESMLFTMLTMATSRMIAAYGADAIAVSRVGSQIESLSWLIGGGYGSALTAFVGQNYGAGKWDRIRKSFRISMWAMALWGVIVTLILIFFGRVLFTLFLPDPGVVGLGVGYLRVLASCQLAMCIEAVTSGSFRGTGKTTPPSIISIVSNSARVAAAYALSLTSLGIYGVFIGISLGAIARGAWGLIWYFRYDAGRKSEQNRAALPGEA